MVSNPLITDNPRFDVLALAPQGRRDHAGKRPTAVYPNRFRSIGPNGLGDGEADPEVVALFKSFLDHRGEWSWEDRKPYVDAAVRLFGSLHDFLLLQMSNPDICKSRRQFVLETAHFIVHGSRRVSIYTNTSLFNYEQGSTVADSMATTLIHEADSLIELGIPKGLAGISLWLSKPHGFNDMVCSMAAFFGPRGPVAG